MRHLIAAGLLATTAIATPSTAKEFSPVAEFIGPLFTNPASVDAMNTRCDEFVVEAEARSAALASSAGPYTVETTLASYDEIIAVIFAGAAQFYNLNQSADSAEKRAAGLACYSRLVEVESELELSRPVYDRLSTIDATRSDEATQLYLKELLDTYKRNGVQLDDDKREQIKALRDEISEIGSIFVANIAKNRRVVRVLPRELDGLPQDWIDARPAGPDGLVEVTTDIPDYSPIMSYAKDDNLRERMARLYASRGYPENAELLGQLFAKRQQLAEMLGKPNFAALYYEDKMLNTVEKVESHIAELHDAVLPAGDRDLAQLKAALEELKPGEDLTVYNSGIARQHLLKTQYALDSQEVREYFTYDNVKKGVFELSEDLFQIEFRPWETETWHPDVETYEIFDSGELLGRIYLDSHPRDGKFKGANHIGIQHGVAGKLLPMSVLTMNLPKGGYDTGKMEHANVETFLHEFGHLLHNILASKHDWYGVSSTTMEWDFVEAPSQMLEEWVYDYETLAKFARNEDGEVIPRELVDKMIAARDFGKGLFELGQLGLTNASFNFHLGAPEDQSAAAISAAYNQYFDEYSALKRPEDTNSVAAFNHLNGYSAGYYTYGWSRVIAADLFSRFEEAGLRDPQTAADYRRYILEPGGSKPAAEMVEDFLGRPVNSDAFKRSLQISK